MQEEIRRKLRDIERQQDVRIIYAVESGSRAWGFASPDSDWDVRYIYVRRPEDYLRVDSIRDTIEGPLDDVLDFSGWDVKKALKLMRRTNPSLMEWSASPIVYRETPAWGLVREAIQNYFSARSVIFHYDSMATGNWHRHMEGEQVRLKKISVCTAAEEGCGRVRADGPHPCVGRFPAGGDGAYPGKHRQDGSNGAAGLGEYQPFVPSGDPAGVGGLTS